MNVMGILWRGRAGELVREVIPWRWKWVVWDYFGEGVQKNLRGKSSHGGGNEWDGMSLKRKYRSVKRGIHPTETEMSRMG